jgi:dsRNA-specific ribonuclease
MKRKKRDLMMIPLYLLVFVSMIGGIFGAGDALMGILGAIWLTGSILAVVALVRKKYKSDISDADAYLVAKKQLNKKLKKQSRKMKYEFWAKYPTHLKPI